MQEQRDRRSAREEVAGDSTKARTIVVMAAATLGVVGFLAAGSIAHSATRSGATVSLRQTALGKVLVAANGRTLYLFAKDRNGKSACAGSCAQYWPPLLTRSKPTAGPGVTASFLGTTKRSNGSVQVTYNRHPLYTYKLDTQAGQTKGEGSVFFGAKWYVLSGSGTAIVRGTPVVTAPGTTTAPYPYP